MLSIINHSFLRVPGYAQVWCERKFILKANPAWPKRDLPSETKGDEFKIGCTHKLDVPMSCFLTWEGTIEGVLILQAAVTSGAVSSPGPGFVFVKPGVNEIIAIIQPEPIPQPEPNPQPQPVPTPEPSPSPLPPGQLPMPARLDTVVLYRSPTDMWPQVQIFGSYGLSVVVPEDLFDRFLTCLENFLREVSDAAANRYTPDT